MTETTKTETTETDELTFELPPEVVEALNTTRDKIQTYLTEARDRFEEADGESHKDADEITSWFDELAELADNLDTMAMEPDTAP
jgi:ElaB/YqjD/DUF883 family membrane-anchored ribosome-binding protein